MSVSDGATGTGSKHKRKVVGVVLLGGEELIVHVDVKGRFYEVFNQVTAHLSLRETEYFGLALLKDAEYQFLVLDEKISKIAPKKWKTSQGEGWDLDGSTPLFTVWFRVQFYVDQVVLLREKVTRHLYYLQLRENVLKYDHLYNEEKCFQVVGYALQADYGNFIHDKHTDGYFDPRHYFPAWMVEKRGLGYLASNSPVVHADLHNLTRSDAQLRYVRDCSSAPGAHNLHFYRARKKKTDKQCNVWLAICYSGIEVYEDDAGFKNLISRFLWQDIGRIVFDKKKFEIRSAESAGGRRFAYYTESDGTAKYLLNLCRATHQFQMAIQPKLMEIRHLEAEDKKRYKESYIYSDARDLHANGGPVRHRSGRSPGKSGVGSQRYSAVSDASSNTTSGIVSDRMALSFDEGEETGREIIIDCPPKQRSLQRAAAHPRMPLRDSYKMTPPTPASCSPALPPQSLELFPSPRGSSGKGSPASPHLPAELSPASSTGSYRAKLPGSYTSKGLGLPLTPSPTSPGKVHPFTKRSPSSPREWDSPGCVSGGSKGAGQDSLKGLQGAVCVERRTVSGDSTTTSGSTASTGTVALSVENSPVTAAVSRGQTPGRSPSFSYTPGRMAQVLPTSVLAGGLIHPAEQPPSIMYPAADPPPSALMYPSADQAMMYPSTDPSPSTLIYPPTDQPPTGCLMYPPTSLPRLEVSEASPSPLHHFPPQKALNPVGGHIYTDTAYTDANLYSADPTIYPDNAAVKTEETVLPPERSEMVKVEEKAGGGGVVGGVLVSASGQPSQAQYKGSAGAVVGVSHSHVVSKGGSGDSGVQASVDGSSGSQHSAQSSEEDPAKNANSATSQPEESASGAGRDGGGKGAIPKRNTPAKVKAGSRAKATHVSVKNQKEALHPDIEQILGQQSQAHSLPFIMALCNDLMTGSSHSSTGSYDTSTRRSSDSDSRRWSTCGTVETAQAAGDPGSGLERYMASSGPGPARPYSWHSEHFDLDTSLRPVPLARGAVCMAPPQHQPQPVVETHRSFPQELCSAANTAHSSVWAHSITQAHRAGAAGGGGAVGGLEGLNRYSPELIAQLMIPSRLSSGGHSASDGGNIGPHKTLKENIGVA